MKAPWSPSKIAITARVAVSCLGRGQSDHVAALGERRSGLSACDFPGVDIPCSIGRVAGIEDDPFPQALAHYDNRASRIAVAAMETEGFGEAVRTALERWSARRVGIVLGTSTSGVERLEQEYRARKDGNSLNPSYVLRHHNDHHAVTSFVQEHLGIEGPGFTVSTACSSSAKALIDAAQLIALDFCDAVLAGGIDSLCLTSLYGFEALELVSRRPCRPFDAARDGLSIGEGAGFALLERSATGPRLLGWGESSDAVSMSTPPDGGAGAVAAMRRALHHAGLNADEIDLVKAHGTATKANDVAEGAAVAAVFGTETRAFSLKGQIGHTLGAAGALEALLCLDAMEAGILPGTAGLETSDPAIAITARRESEKGKASVALANAFGFGGSNATLVLGTR